jgi:hypothetical protein
MAWKSDNKYDIIFCFLRDNYSIISRNVSSSGFYSIEIIDDKTYKNTHYEIIEEDVLRSINPMCCIITFPLYPKPHNVEYLELIQKYWWGNKSDIELAEIDVADCVD